MCLPEIQESSFKHIETFSFDVDVIYSHLAWRKRIIASAGIGAALLSVRVEEFDSEHAARSMGNSPSRFAIIADKG